MIDQVLRSLQHPLRRRILYALLEHDPQEALVVPGDVRPGERGSGDPDVELVHHHLPVLEDTGLIRWEREAGRVHDGPEFDEARPLVEAVREHDFVREPR